MHEIDRPQHPGEPFLNDAELALERLERAVRQGRPANVAACAAALARASSDAGAGVVAAIAEELELRAGHGDLGLAAHLLASLERAVVQLAAAPDLALVPANAPAPRAATESQLNAPGAPWGGPSQPPPSYPHGVGAGPPQSPRRPAAWVNAWIPLAALLATFALVARFASPATLSGATTYAAAGVLVLALLRLLTTFVEDRRAADAVRATLRALQAGDPQLAMLFEHNPQPMWVYDRETLAILEVSNAAVAAYGYTREQFLSMRITDLRAPEDLPSLFDFLDTASGPGHLGFSPADPWRHVRRDGTIIEVEVSSDDVIFRGRDCRIVLSQDVTARNRLDAELAAARDQAVEAANLKSAFLATISHEMRTPMQGVIGMNEALLGTELTGEQRRCAELVARSSEQMLAIVEDVLDIAALESGERALSSGSFDLHDAIRRACTPARVEATAKGLQFEISIEAGVPRWVVGDRDTLRRAISKLVANAVKFSDDGIVFVHVGSPDPAAAGRRRRVCVAVSDTGIGVDGAALERVFDPFVQGDAATTRQYGGVGLGLAIARELVELMGGVLCAESEPGRGSTFWFELTVEAASPGEPAGPRLGHAGAARRAPLVLLAEDSHINQIAAVGALRRCGCRVDVVADGDEALQALALRHYDAVLMDCNMPRVDGFEATARLRREEHGRRTPVIAMTASGRESEEARCRLAGMDASIAKPMRPEVLAETLARWIPAVAAGAGVSGGRAVPRRLAS